MATLGAPRNAERYPRIVDPGHRLRPRHDCFGGYGDASNDDASDPRTREEGGGILPHQRQRRRVAVP